MRIVAGTYRGRRLAAPRGTFVRPTADRVREAVYSMLGDVHGLEVLDLFAGTGAMGLEALSRGAARATFVELDRQACEIVRRNIDATVSGEDGTTQLVKGDAVRVVRSFALADRRFDLVCFDPPYDATAELLAELRGSLPTVLAGRARVVLEVAARHRELIASAAAGWDAEILVERSYGDTSVGILRIDGRDAHDPLVMDDSSDEDRSAGE